MKIVLRHIINTSKIINVTNVLLLVQIAKTSIHVNLVYKILVIIFQENAFKTALIDTIKQISTFLHMFANSAIYLASFVKLYLIIALAAKIVFI